MMESTRAIPSGIEAIDKLLGGWPKGVMTLLVGETGVGKSTLLIASGTSVAERGIKVFYIDVEGNLIANPPKNMLVEGASSSMEELSTAISKLSALPPATLRDSLIIVDSITYHYHALIRAAEKEDERNRLQAILESLVYRLHSLTVRNNAATVMTTWPTSYGEEESDFVGGFAVKTYTRVQLRMEFTDLDEVRVIRVVKHQDLTRYGMSAPLHFRELSAKIFQPVEEV